MKLLNMSLLLMSLAFVSCGHWGHNHKHGKCCGDKKECSRHKKECKHGDKKCCKGKKGEKKKMNKDCPDCQKGSCNSKECAR